MILISKKIRKNKGKSYRKSGRKVLESSFFLARKRTQSAVWPDWAIFNKFWGQILLQKLPKCLMTFLGYCKKCHFLRRTAADTFWPIIGQNWPTFYSNIWSHWQSAAEKKTKKVCREAFESGKKAFRVPPSARACARVSASSSVPFLLELAFRFLANHWMPETFHFLPKLSLCRLRALFLNSEFFSWSQLSCDLLNPV